MPPRPLLRCAPMSPPEKLRAELQQHRARGHWFNAAWPAAVSAALRDEHVEVAVFWGWCWQTEQRQLWATAYPRAPWPANQRPALATPDDDRSGHGGNTHRVAVVA